MHLNNLNSLVDYLVDSGIDEGEINYFLHQKRYQLYNKSIMDLIRDDAWEVIWGFVVSYISGE